MEHATVVLYPDPAIGHLVSMVEFGKLIHKHHPSLSIIILTIPPKPNETVSINKYINSVSNLTFHHLPANVVPKDFPAGHLDRAFGIPELYNPLVHEALVSISKKSHIKAVVLDFFTNAAFQVSKKLGLPTLYFYTGGASLLCVFLNIPTLENKKFVTKDRKDNKDSSSVSYYQVPGVPTMPASDLPPVVLQGNYYNKYFLDTSINMANSDGIVLNSFTEFEQRAVRTLRDGEVIEDGVAPPVYLVGPLIAKGDHVDPREDECLKWLEMQPSRSVVFLCFGSMGVLKREQLLEIGVGLERSGQRFLWVVRDPPDGEKDLDSGVEGFLPDGFLTRVGDKGLVVRNWAPQQVILSHGSVGGFVSHCGWNSLLEAVVAGVPIIAWPLYAEQKMNRAFLVQEAKVALAVEMLEDDFVKAEAVEEKVRELMVGEEGRVVRERVLELSGVAKGALDEGGSSRDEFFKLTQPWTAP